MVKIKHIVFILIFCCAGILKSQKEKITITITYKTPYCGGARPTPEMVAESEKSKAYANKIIVIVSDKNKIDSAKTNNKGQLVLKLSKGNYNLYEAWKFYKAGPEGMAVSKFDKNCLKTEWEKPIYSITKVSKKATVESKGEILIPCPWALPCMRPENMPPVPE